MEEKASTPWPDCVRRSCRRIPSPDACSCFGAAVGQRFVYSVTTARDTGWAQKRLSKGRFIWWPEATEPTKSLEAFEVQLLMAAGDVSRVRAAPMWRRVKALK